MNLHETTKFEEIFSKSVKKKKEYEIDKIE